MEEEEEEFQEADILWPDATEELELQVFTWPYCGHGGDDDDDSDDHRPFQPHNPVPKVSSPIGIPGKVSAKGLRAPGFSKFEDSLCVDRAGGSSVVSGRNFVPPHVIVDRRAKRDKAMMFRRAKGYVGQVPG